jgi:Zn finger protein HypA/HybF involved in hydrogenase expression
MDNGNRWARKCKTCSYRYTWEGSIQADPGCPKCNPKPVRLTGVDPVRQAKEVNAALDQCQEILSQVEQLPSRAEDFGESVADQVRDVAVTIGKTNRVTTGQQRALDNWQAGVEAWFHE